MTDSTLTFSGLSLSSQCFTIIVMDDALTESCESFVYQFSTDNSRVVLPLDQRTTINDEDGRCIAGA